MSAAKTIYAQASGMGKAGIAVLRLSGSDAYDAGLRLSHRASLQARHAHFCALYDPESQRKLDEVLLLFFPAPHSFTGEDVLEIHCHGSQAVLALLMECLGRMPGLRQAEAGEFTRRAVLHGKMDISEAEGLADVIDAITPTQHAQAMAQLDGRLSQACLQWRESMIDLMSLSEAYIDFPDEDIPASVVSDAVTQAQRLLEAIETASTNPVGERIRSGIELAIIGAPNAGKSTLLNWLAKRDVAITSSMAGTTRDVLEVALDIEGIAVTAYDTAGLREYTSDVIEQEGIKRAKHVLQQAGIIVHVVDASAPDATLKLDVPSHATLLRVYNKSDKAVAPKGVLSISLTSQQGLDALLAQITQAVLALTASVSPPLFTRSRHHEAALEACAALRDYTAHMQHADPPELAAESLRLATGAIGRITHATDVDEVLEQIFSRFCIGK